MKAKITVNADQLRAISMFVSSDETRYILNGVHIEIDQSNGILFVAIDGRRLVAANLDILKFEWEEEQQFTIPQRLLDLIPDGAPEVTIERDGDNVSVSAWNEVQITGKLIPGIYPNWRKIFPAQFPTSAGPDLISVNADFWNDIAKFTSLFSRSSPNILCGKVNEFGPCYLVSGRRFIIALMGVVVEGKNPEQMPRPSFLDKNPFATP